MKKKNKEDNTLQNLNEIYEKDFSVELTETYKAFEEKLIESIKNPDRSIESQKIEAMAKTAEHKNRNIISMTSLLFSFTAIIITFINSYFQKISGCTGFIIIILIVALYITFGIVIKTQTISYKEISYYKIKLYCIEKIENDVSNAVNTDI